MTVLSVVRKLLEEVLLVSGTAVLVRKPLLVVLTLSQLLLPLLLDQPFVV